MDRDEIIEVILDLYSIQKKYYYEQPIEDHLIDIIDEHATIPNGITGHEIGILQRCFRENDYSAFIEYMIKEQLLEERPEPIEDEKLASLREKYNYTGI